jgi:hypothetical protein
MNVFCCILLHYSGTVFKAQLTWESMMYFEKIGYLSKTAGKNDEKNCKYGNLVLQRYLSHIERGTSGIRSMARKKAMI